MDYQVVGSPSNYGAPQVFDQGNQQNQQKQGQAQQPQPAQQIAAVLQKAKQLLSQGTISAEQYNQIASQYAPDTELATSGGNMGAGMPQGGGAPMNILPGQGG